MNATEGMVVHFVTAEKKHRPALVVRFEDEKPRPRAVVDLHVFFAADDTEVSLHGRRDTAVDGVSFDPWGMVPHTWHYPEEARR